ncbi:serine/threonine-protein kinase [Streptomyces sp. RerS4]|uniref:serine/threonine-protein kinase n=1 Tax=Streptomyces sp. RerS4 TaxID=2942449 RepID=UPI00201C2A05|nr:serine/threonine-protein kinase [Streptomyces sp. RerS4]UQX03624.1 serine/threonine protein kinase [Streptomyces sp. RerS4]
MNGHETAGAFEPLAADDPPMVSGYRIAARLGAGGMGKVYLSHTPGGRPVAIKVIRPEFAEDAEFRRRFRQEVQSAQRVQGLYTAPVIDSDTDGPIPWLATAFVPGPTLAAAVAEHGPLPARTILMLVAGIAEALQVIHGAGIVHRDLKPSNVLLAADGPRVIDFGIARAADATSLTASGVAVGTPAFMAPEQAEGGEISGATDVFALGQVAAYAALGAPAYGDGPSHGVLYRIVHEEPDLSRLPEALRPLVTRCLVKNPSGRASLTEILDLCRTAADQTQLRRPEDWLPEGVAAGIAKRPQTPAPIPTVVVPNATPLPPTRTATPPPHQAYAPPPAYGPTYPGPSPHAGPPPYAGPPPHAAPPAYVTQPTYAAPQPAPAGPAPMIVIPRPPGSNRTAVALIWIFAVLFFLVVGCAAVLGAVGNDTTRGGAGSTPDATSTAPRPDPKPVEYKGLNLADDYQLNFADDTLTPREDSGDLSYRCSSGICHFGASGSKLARLDSGTEGSLQVCRQETRFTGEIPVAALSKGDAMCLRTSEGTIALIVYRGSSPKNDPSTYATLDVTVWRAAARKD